MGSEGAGCPAGAQGPQGVKGDDPIANNHMITVASLSGGNKYYVDLNQQGELTLYKGFTYTFDQSNASNSNHPLRLSFTNDGTHNGGIPYVNGFTYSGTQVLMVLLLLKFLQWLLH